MSGAGIQPAGLSPAGVGTPGVAAISGGVPLRDAANGGGSLAGRFIDPFTRQFVFDVNGRTLGMTETRQLVQLAVQTTRGKSAVRSLGNDMFTIDRITDSFVQRVQTVYQNALADLVARKLITIVAIDVTPNVNGSPTRAFVLVKYQDLTVGSLGQYGVEETIPI